MTTPATNHRTPGRRGRGTPPRIPGDRKIYTKPTRTTGRTAFYGDFREFAALGGRCEALRPEGARHATTDIAEALACYDARRRHLEALRDGARDGTAAPQTPEEAGDDRADRPTHLGPLLARHIREKHAAGKRRGTLERMEDAARVLIRELGNCPLAAVTVERVQRYVQDRRRHRRPQTGKLTSTATIRIELSLLADAFTRAIAYGWAHQNPVRLLPDKPHAPPARNVWLTRAESGALLDAAAEHDALARRDAARTTAWSLDPRDPIWQDTEHAAKKRGRAVQWEQRRDDAEAILDTLLYTGGRIAEVLGLLTNEVDFGAGTLAFRHNRLRRLKREWHERTVELWPPLAAVLRDHVARLGLGPDDPLFPTAPGSDQPVIRIDKLLARCCRRAGLAGRDLSPHALRHTFATTLLRTYAPTATGARVQRSAFDVAKALGHGSSALVDKVYGHPSAEECTDTLTYEEHRRHPALGR